jgi:hypothetical protein
MLAKSRGRGGVIQGAVVIPRTQHALEDPETWNSQWESQFPLFEKSPKGLFKNYLDLSKNARMSTSHRSHYYSTLLATTISTLFHVGVQSLQVLSREDFENKWTNAGVAVRRQHVLRALSEACSMARNLNEARGTACSLLTVDGLSKDPQVLIGMMKKLVPEDIEAEPKFPIYFENPSWDAFKAQKQRSSMTEEEKICLAEMHILQTKLICASDLCNRSSADVLQTMSSSSPFFRSMTGNSPR